MQLEPVTTANGSCHMSCDIVWLSDGGDLGDFRKWVRQIMDELLIAKVVSKQKPDHKIESPIGLP